VDKGQDPLLPRKNGVQDQKCMPTPSFQEKKKGRTLNQALPLDARA